MSRYALVPAARLDLREIVQYVGSYSPSAARRVQTTLFAAFEVLSDQPGLGHRRSDLTDRDLRFWTVMGRYMIVYREQPESIQVVRVLGAGRDVASILGGRSNS